ncbi:MAG: hypothetical protein MUF07_07155 [Steroidobacteraceae bacterium]|jgi:hypothetical protein|nr:hypothetical protein [Steroidobacteraceae bacterium]
MDDESSKEPRKRSGKGGAGSGRASPNEVEVTFWTRFDKREEVRTIRRVHGRTSKSLLNEALDLLISKYNSQ